MIPATDDGARQDSPDGEPAKRTRRKEDGGNPYKGLFQLLPYGVVLFDATLSVQEANRAAMKMLGLTGRHFDRKVGSPEWEFTDVNGRRLAFHELPLSRSFSSAKPVRNFTVGAFNPIAKKQIWLRGDVLPHQTGRKLQYWAVFRDVTKEFETEAARNSG
jgi:PAS domain-containing protein